MQDLNWTNSVYMFHEAFPAELVLYVYHLFMASTTAQYIVTFKAGKKSMGNKYLLHGFLNPMKSSALLKSEFTNQAAISTVKSVL